MTAFGPGFTCAGLLLEARMIWPAIAILAFVTLQRLAELPLADAQHQAPARRGRA